MNPILTTDEIKTWDQWILNKKAILTYKIINNLNNLEDIYNKKNKRKRKNKKIPQHA